MSIRLVIPIMLLCAATASAQTALAWKFEKGQVYEVERMAAQKQTVELKGKQFATKSSSTWHVRLEVKEKRDDRFAIEATLTRVQQESSDANAIDLKLAEKMQGSVFTLEVATDGRILAMQGYEDFLKRLADTDRDRQKAVRVTFPEAAIKDMLADLFGPLPARRVAKGDTWEREYVEPIPHFGSFRSTASYTYQGPEGGTDRIAYTIRTKYAPPAKDERALFQIVKGSIDADKAAGKIVFDSAAGRLIEHERTMVLRGALTIDALEKEQTLTFASENVLRIRVTLGK
jgi:hypothetical protein